MENKSIATAPFKGKISKYNLQLAEFFVYKLKQAKVVPEGNDIQIQDDGKVWINIVETNSCFEIRCHGGNLGYSVLLWMGGTSGEKSLAKRVINVPLADTVEFIGNIFKAFSMAQVLGGEYLGRNPEPGSQDADMEENNTKLAQHFSRNAGIKNDPSEESEIEYYKSMAKEMGGTDAYDLSSLKTVKKTDAPSAGRQLQAHMGQGELADKKKIKTPNNIVTLREGEKSRKVPGLGVMVKDEHGNVKFITENTEILQKKTQWGKKNGQAVLFEIINKLQ